MTHVSSAVFLKSAGLDMIHVPYKGVAPAFNDLMAGHVAMLSASPVEIKPFMESEKVKPLAVTSTQAFDAASRRAGDHRTREGQPAGRDL